MFDLLIRGANSGLFLDDRHCSTTLVLTVRQTYEAVNTLGLLYSTPHVDYNDRRAGNSGVAAAKRAKMKRKRAGK